MSNLSILMEAYRGKKNEFPEIEAQLKILINTIRQDAINSLDFKSLSREPLDLHNHPANKKVEKLLAQAFKLKEVNIYWKPKMYNAATVPPFLPRIAELNKNLDKDNVMSNAKINIYIGEPIIALTTINEKELLAIILHELGHCHALSPIMNVVRFLQMTVCLPFTLLGKLSIYTGIKLDEFMRKHIPILYNLGRRYGMLDMSIMHPVRTIMKAGSKIDIGSRDSFTIGISYGQYNDEKAADSFSTSFGYAPYLISALNKLNNVDNSIGSEAIKSNDLTRIMVDVADVYLSFIRVIIMEPHPSLNTRYHNALRNLKEDLQDPELDPSYKKEMLQQIKELEDAYDNLGKHGGNGMELKYHVNKFIDNLTGDKPDFRELFNGIYSDKYRF